jgi:hypothetical protein
MEYPRQSCFVFYAMALAIPRMNEGEIGRPDVRGMITKGPDMLGLEEDSDHAEAAPTLLASAFYHVACP